VVFFSPPIGFACFSFHGQRRGGTEGANSFSQRGLQHNYYQPGNQKSLELEVFLEREKNLKLQVERLGKSQAEIQQETERSREDSLKCPQQLPSAIEGPAG